MPRQANASLLLSGDLGKALPTAATRWRSGKSYQQRPASLVQLQASHEKLLLNTGAHCKPQAGPGVSPLYLPGDISPCSHLEMGTRLFKTTHPADKQLPVGVQKPREACAAVRASQPAIRVSYAKEPRGLSVKHIWWSHLEKSHCTALASVCATATQGTRSRSEEGKGTICSSHPWSGEPRGPTKHSWVMQVPLPHLCQLAELCRVKHLPCLFTGL